jgi:hypothetical protein
MPHVRSHRRRFTTLLLLAAAACRGTSATEPPISPPLTPVEDPDLVDARLAWRYVENNTLPTTGLANAVDGFQHVTVWDIASLIGAVYSAHELRILGDAAYDARIRQILGTLAQMPLFDGAAFNRFYDGKTGQMVDRNFKATATGYGWSATDIGRLLVWLRVLAVNQPQYADQAAAIAKRIDYSRIVKNGNLEAIDIDPTTGAIHYYAETGLGYEQYAAAGFALWGRRAANAIDPSLNAATAQVYGVNIAVDKRNTGRITSEPYVMMGLETGWFSPVLRDDATAVLAAQQARHQRTGTMTIVSEDHLPDAPYKFYYYSVYSHGRDFVVEGPVQGTFVERPRWVSAKAAFAWRSLMPSSFTDAAVQVVRAAAIPGRGWGAGVYEDGTPTGEANLNTAGMILEALAYRRSGRPFLQEPIS